MKLLFIIVSCALFFAGASGLALERSAKVLEELSGQQLVDYVNSRQSSWRAEHNERFADEATRKFYLGTIINKHMQKHYSKQQPLPKEQIPAEFDARTKWPQCSSIGAVRDQSQCGSCWAVAASECMTDRICIASNGATQTVISAADLLSCCDYCGYGCQGGYPIKAWQFYTRSGVVSGGWSDTMSGCKPYPFPKCVYLNETYNPCKGHSFDTPKCEQKCQDSFTNKYTDDKSLGKSNYYVKANVQAIQTEVMTNGPVEAAFDVYADFFDYKDGVYQHLVGKYQGGHAVKIIGWGTENGKDYWLVANSWNELWGDKGFFKMLRGTDECGFESEITAGLAKM